jgi:glycosyltransferase involved in cell wall biosynthesis
MMKVAFLIHNTEAPSCRYRVLQYFPYLKQQGTEVSTHLFRHNLMDKWKFYATLGEYDLIFIQRKLFHPVDFWYIRRKAKKIVYDFDDAVMYRSAKSKNPHSFSRRIKFARMMKRADLIIAGNEFLKTKALPHNSNVVVIPTSIDLSQYSLKEDLHHGGQITIGWLGSRSSLRYLRSLLPTFENIFKKYPNIQLKIVCSEFLDSPHLPIIKKPWSWEEEEEDLKSFDIGVMPLSNDLWSKGKCGLKILQYFSVGIPTICTPVGMNKDIVEEGVNGFWATTTEEWEEKLSILIENPTLREKMGKEGRDKVLEEYSLQASAPRLFAILKQVAEKNELGKQG